MSNRRLGGSALLPALLFLFTMGIQAGELEQRFTSALATAKAGDAAAMYSVGEMYELGMGTASSRAEALTWYRAAANKGHPEGAYQVGYAYYWGKGVDKDRRQAHVWFLRAAEGGSQAAMPYLAKMYALGQGVPKDKEQSALWAARADAVSHIHAPPPVPKQAVTKAAEDKPQAETPSEAQAAASPEPKPAPKPAEKAEPKQVATAAPQAKPKPKPAVKPKPKASAEEQQMQRLLAVGWQKGSRPALYLPSAQTDCQKEQGEIACQSEPKRSSLLGRPYAFRYVATLGEFTAKGGFSLIYQPEVIEILEATPGGYGSDEEVAEPIDPKALRQRVERAPEQLSCEFVNDQKLRCVDDKGVSQEFTGAKAAT